MSEKSNELIIDAELLADIQRRCRQRVAEFEAAQRVPPAPILSEAERFAAAVEAMPPNVGRFFEHDAVPLHRWESDRDRAQRGQLTDLGGWPGG
jgi:hypothetical protein